MTGKPRMRVAIIGGGTAGWMAAAALSQHFGTALSITLVESDTIGTIGVGEATIPQIRRFNASLGIDEKDFLRATGGTFKLGIEFIGWQRDGSRYFHGFGDVGRSLGLVPFYHYWLRYQQEGGGRALEAFNLHARAAHAGRFGPGTGRATPLPSAAYHFDAGRYAAFLRRFAEARGVTRMQGEVRTWQRDGETGFIRSLSLGDGRDLKADFFIDCTGFRALLIGGALQGRFEDWSRWLVCDRAFACPSEGRGRLDPFTRSTARQAGWQWEIPLRDRTGNGHVYASAFTDDESAAKTLMDTLPGRALGDPVPLCFATGYRPEMWTANCVSLGLASGFLEPLESTSIHLIQAGIARLVSLFPTADCAPPLAAAFNRQMAAEYCAIRDFLVLHYHLNERQGTLWDYCRSMPLPDSLQERIALFRSTGRIQRRDNDLFDVPSWLQVMWGQGLRPQGRHPMVDAASADDLRRYIAMNDRETLAAVDALGAHDAHIARINAQGPPDASDAVAGVDRL